MATFGGNSSPDPQDATRLGPQPGDQGGLGTVVGAVDRRVEPITECEQFNDRQSEQDRPRGRPRHFPSRRQGRQGGESGEFGGREPELPGDVGEGLPDLPVGPAQVDPLVGPFGREGGPSVVPFRAGTEPGSSPLNAERRETQDDGGHGPERDPGAGRAGRGEGRTGGRARRPRA